MRRALRLILVAALAAALAAAATGWHAFVTLGDTDGSGAAVNALDGSGLLLHAILGHLTAALTGLVAAMALVLGLQGLLDAAGRRVLSGVLFALAPTLAWLALGAEFSGRVDGELVDAGLLHAELDRILQDHAVLHGGGLLLALLATGIAAWRLSRGMAAENG